MSRITRREFNIVAGSLLVGGSNVLAKTKDDGKIKVLMMSGQNNHDWRRTSPIMKTILEECGRFKVDLMFSPPKEAPESAWKTWRPAFKKYDLVFSDYNGQMWPEPVREDFEAYISHGGRALIQHAANNPFSGWDAFEKMAGLLWRGENTGYRVFIDDDGKVHRLGPGKGGGAGHGKLHDWQIAAREPEHPIFKDAPKVWLHAYDELYHRQRGPAEDMHILATAYSDPESGGTGKHELMIWWIPFGKGKVLSFMPGHLWPGQEDTRTFRCVGFRNMLQRCSEWVATDKVTIPVPDNFPTADKVSILPAKK